MSIKNMKKEELELLSHKDLTHMLLEENGSMNTAELFKTITDLLELPKSVFETKIGDYYMALSTDKRFILLDDGNWDLSNKHTSDKLKKNVEDEDEAELDEEAEPVKDEDIDEPDDEEDDYESGSDDDKYDDSDDDLKDLVIIDEDELEMDE